MKRYTRPTTTSQPIAFRGIICESPEIVMPGVNPGSQGTQPGGMG